MSRGPGRSSPPRLRAVAALVAVVLVAAACSDDGSGAAVEVGESGTDPCDWPTWGHGNHRTFSYPCDSGISPDTVPDLHRVWYVETSDAVTAAPVVVGGTVYVGDWAGRFYALDAASGAEQWVYDAEPSPTVYAGQITASAAVADGADGERLVVFNGGRTVHALAAADGTERWTRVLGEDGDSTEIETAPLLVGDTAIITYDVHNGPFPAGVLALDLQTGEERWALDLEDGDHNGCGDVWGAASVDERRLVFFGTASCPVPDQGWTDYNEAIVAVDLDSGEPEWSFQPHEPNNDDTDFAGAPLLFEAGGQDLVGLGSKDAAFYAVDRETGAPAWETQATEPNNIRPGFATGGFIGPSTHADGVIAGGTGVGPCPCMHGLDAATGEVLWQQDAVGPTYAPSTEVGGVVFVGSLDFALRALDLRTGEVLWSDALTGLVSGGVAVVGDDVWAVAGFREPGSPGPSANSGVFRYTIDPSVATLAELPPPTTAAPPATDEPSRLVDRAGPCVDQPCELGFDLKEPPPGVTPVATLSIRPDPLRITIDADGLGPPDGWLRPGSPAEAVGAGSYALMISERDDEPNGGFLCMLENDTCTATTVPDPGASYNRISLLALADADRVPDPADGFDRLVTTISFDEPLRTEAIDP